MERNYENISWETLGREWNDVTSELRKKLNVKVEVRDNKGTCGFYSSLSADGCRITTKKPSAETCKRCEFFKTPEQAKKIEENYKRYQARKKAMKWN